MKNKKNNLILSLFIISVMILGSMISVFADADKGNVYEEKVLQHYVNTAEFLPDNSNGNIRLYRASSNYKLVGSEVEKIQKRWPTSHDTIKYLARGWTNVADENGNAAYHYTLAQLVYQGKVIASSDKEWGSGIVSAESVGISQSTAAANSTARIFYGW